MGAFDITRPLVAAGAVGLAQRCLTEATKYAHDRKTFGVPIIQHQAIGTMLAEMAIGTETARWVFTILFGNFSFKKSRVGRELIRPRFFSFSIEWLFGELVSFLTSCRVGRNRRPGRLIILSLSVSIACAKDANSPRTTYYASIAKAHASQVACANADRCVQIHGGAGYNEEYGAAKLLRWAKNTKFDKRFRRMIFAFSLIRVADSHSPLFRNLRDSRIFQIYEGTTQVSLLLSYSSNFAKFPLIDLDFLLLWKTDPKPHHQSCSSQWLSINRSPYPPLQTITLSDSSRFDSFSLSRLYSIRFFPFSFVCLQLVLSSSSQSIVSVPNLID